MSCSIVTAVHNQSAYTWLFLDSLRKTVRTAHQVVVVDNGSRDATPSVLARFATVEVIRNEDNLGISRAWNQGIGAAHGDYIAVCNNDIVFSPGWLSALTAELDARPELGAVFATTNHQVLVSDRAHFRVVADGLAGRPAPGPTWTQVDRFYHGGFFAFTQEFGRRYGVVRLRRDCIACSLFRRAAFEAAGLFDEGLGPGWEDVDLIQRMLLQPPHLLYETVGSAYVHHFGAVTRAQFPGPQLLPDRFNRKWHPFGTLAIGRYEGGCSRQDLAGLRADIAPVLPFLAEGRVGP